MREHRLRVHVPPPDGGRLMGDARIAAHPRWVEVDGAPAVPVVAGMDYSRVPAALWQDSLRRIREGGATAVATTVFWNHHEPVRGEPDFTGGLDLAGFARLARASGLGLVLRLGPQARTGARHTGLPDWLLALPVAARTDDPGYLAEVVRWFAAVSAQLVGFPLLAVQFDSAAGEPGHLSTLKVVTRQVGLDAPLWLLTGGAADGFLPAGAALPDAYWVSAGTERYATDAFGFTAPNGTSPYLVAELGAGMVPSAHRRPYLGARDIAALALSRLGAGSSWQGYAQFQDGRNPRPGLQESHAAGAPSDLAELDSDAGAPLAVDGHRRASWYRLRLQHLLLAAWGDRLATMAPTLPDEPDPRWAVRSDGRSGFLFVTNRPSGPRRAGLQQARFVVETAAGEVAFPPVDVPPAAAFAWPFGLVVGDAELEWATAQPVTELVWRARPLLVLAATAGVEPRLRWRSGEPRELTTKGAGHFGELVTERGVAVRWLVLSEPDAWRFGLPDGLELTSDGVRDQASRRASTPVVGSSVVGHAGSPPAPRTGPMGRTGVPADWGTAARVELRLPSAPGASLVLDWVGDAARLWDGERLVADSLWTGRDWRIPASDLLGATDLVAEFVRLHPDAVVHLTHGRPRGARLNHARLEYP
ncbi:MAG: beta-galactosidase [Propionicimonas sp.]|nr:beta-galactosidase [Propionicimonas sp.]